MLKHFLAALFISHLYKMYFFRLKKYVDVFAWVLSCCQSICLHTNTILFDWTICYWIGSVFCFAINIAYSCMFCLALQLILWYMLLLPLILGISIPGCITVSVGVPCIFQKLLFGVKSENK